MSKKQRIVLAGLIIITICGLIVGLTMVGEIGTLPQVITLYVTGFGAGASLTAFIKERHINRNTHNKHSSMINKQ
jgi:hypothetical protein